MVTILVHLSSALLCYAGQCHPVLVGRDTPTGTFPVQHAITHDPGYGGDVLAFARAADGGVYAIHRLWVRSPRQHRTEKLADPDPGVRRQVTGGCINLDPAVYEDLVKATREPSLVIIDRD